MEKVICPEWEKCEYDCLANRLHRKIKGCEVIEKLTQCGRKNPYRFLTKNEITHFKTIH